MSTCKTATPPRRPAEIENSKLYTMFLTTLPRKLTEDFSKFCPYVEKIDFEGGPR